VLLSITSIIGKRALELGMNHTMKRSNEIELFAVLFIAIDDYY
jgi:hypothetical protein